MRRKKCYWLLNHQILDIQKEDLRKNFGVGEFVMPTAEIAALWGSVPTTQTIPDSYFEELEAWFGDASSSDVAVIQGEPTASFKVVSYLLKKGITVLAGITERKSVDREQDGKVIKTSVFEHVCFRRYEF